MASVGAMGTMDMRKTVQKVSAFHWDLGWQVLWTGFPCDSLTCVPLVTLITNVWVMQA